MNYILHNKELIKGNSQRQLFLKTVEKNLTFFKKLKSGTKTKDSLVVYLSQSSKPRALKISLYLNFYDNQLFVDGEGDQPIDLMNDLMVQLKSMYLRKSLAHQKEKKQEAVRTHVDKLKGLKHLGDKQQFDFLMKRLTPAINGFVSKYLAHKQKGIDPAITIEDVVDEIYLAIFEKFEDRPLDNEKVSPWSYQIARETMEKLIHENPADEGKVKLSKLAKKELSELEEEYTTDAEGELIMFEELDDISYRKMKYPEETKMDTALIEHTENPEFNEVLNDILKTTSSEKRTIFQLYWFHELTEREIASAMDMPLKTVKSIINSITEEIIDNQKI